MHIFAESRGEESCSIAIALDAAGLLDQCELSASDIDPTLVSIAQAGVINKCGYVRLPAYARDYFAVGGDQAYYLRPALNTRISHSVKDVLQLDQVRGPYDLILMQNLLVHLSPVEQRIAIRNVASGQATGGYLALGGVQTLHLKNELSRLGYTPVLEKAREIYEAWDIQINAWTRVPRPYWALPPFDPNNDLAQYSTIFCWSGH